MSQHKKLLVLAQHHPDGLRFSELQTLMRQCGWIMDHQTGSHQIWISPKRFRLSVQNRNGQAKGYQVKQFLTRLEEEKDNDRIF